MITNDRAMEDGWCPIHLFAADGDLVAIKQLNLENTVPTFTKKHETALDLAIEFGHEDCVDHFVNNWPMNWPIMVEPHTEKGDNLLHIAVRFNQIDVLTLLLRKVLGGRHHLNNNKQTPLELAIEMGFVDALHILVTDTPESLSYVDYNNRTLLHLAVFYRQIDALKYLLPLVPKHCLLIQDHWGFTPLNAVFDFEDDWTGDDETMVKLLGDADPAAIDIPHVQGMTPFLEAACRRSSSIMEFFMQQNPSVVNARTFNGQTALHFINDVNIAKKILEINPDLIRALDKRNENALHTMYVYNQDYIRFLLETEPSLLSAENVDGLTPFQRAVIATSIDHMMSDFLHTMLDFKPDLVDTDKLGNTVLHNAVAYCHRETIALVFANRMSNLYAINVDGETPFHIAFRKKHVFALRLFQKHVTAEMIVQTQAQTVDGLNFQALLMQQCDSLDDSLLPDLVSIIYGYVGVTNKKRKHI